jgi:hypothetical protein
MSPNSRPGDLGYPPRRGIVLFLSLFTCSKLTVAFRHIFQLQIGAYLLEISRFAVFWARQKIIVIASSGRIERM